MTVTVNAADLWGTLADLVRTAHRDQCFPMLNGIMLHAHQDTGRLYATSTDRAMLGQAWLPAEGDLQATLLPLRSVAVMRALLAGCILPISLERSGYDLTVVRPDGGSLGIAAADDGGFPKIDRLVQEHASATQGDQAALSPALLGKLVMIANRRKESLVLRMGQDRRASMFEIGDRYRALLMPVARAGSETFVWSSPQSRKADDHG